ncbi:MAG: helix-turn-helix transcriptional regulator [Clostridia bacterium]|nr:helix-turn-helix transcriptional regulator [Clostridia bacterium]
MDMKKIGSFLRSLRKEKGLTQEQLAEKLGVAGRTVSRWETASNMPDLSILIQLADFYDVDIREIIDGERQSEDLVKEQKEMLMRMSEYSNTKEKMLLRKLITIVMIGVISWVTSFSFILLFLNSAKGAGFILAAETIVLLFYGTIMFIIKFNRSADNFLNVVIGAVSAITVSNIIHLCIFLVQAVTTITV